MIVISIILRIAGKNVKPRYAGLYRTFYMEIRNAFLPGVLPAWKWVYYFFPLHY